MKNLLKILVTILLLPLIVVANVISIVSLILTSPIWVATWIKWYRGEATHRDWYNAVYRCGLITAPLASDSYYKTFVGWEYTSRYKKLKKLWARVKKEENLVMELIKEYDSLK